MQAGRRGIVVVGVVGVVVVVVDVVVVYSGFLERIWWWGVSRGEGIEEGEGDLCR